MVREHSPSTWQQHGDERRPHSNMVRQPSSHVDTGNTHTIHITTRILIYKIVNDFEYILCLKISHYVYPSTVCVCVVCGPAVK